MVAHYDLLDTSVKRETTPPSTPPMAIGQVHVENGANSTCIRVAAATASVSDYKPAGFLPMISTGDPSGSLTSRFALDLAIDTTNNTLYFAATANSTSWTSLVADASSASVEGAITREFLEDTLASSFPFAYNDGSNNFTFVPAATDGYIWATTSGIAQWVDPSTIGLGGGGGGGSVTREQVEDLLASSFSFATYDDTGNVFNFSSPPDALAPYVWFVPDGSSTPQWADARYAFTDFYAAINVDGGLNVTNGDIVVTSAGIKTENGISVGVNYALTIDSGYLGLSVSEDDGNTLIVTNDSSTIYTVSYQERAELYSKAHYPATVILPSSGSSLTIDLSESDCFYLGLNRNITSAIADPPFTGTIDHGRFKLFIEQLGGNRRGAGAGGAGFTFNFPTSWRFPAGPPTAPDYQYDIMMLDCTFIRGDGGDYTWLCTYISPDAATVEGEDWNVYYTP